MGIHTGRFRLHLDIADTQERLDLILSTDRDYIGAQRFF